MKVETSYTIEVKGIDKYFRVISRIWKKMFSYLVPIVEHHWEGELDCISGTKAKQTYVRNLVHGSHGYEAVYDFDKRFPNTPSYFLTAILNAVVGHVSSYHSNLENYEDTGRGGKPTLSTKTNKLPVFYNKNMYVNDEKLPPYTVRLKLFVGNSWDWVQVRLKPTDCKYIARHCNMKSMSCPTLERKNKKWFLRFSFEDKVELKDTPLQQRKICAVDLGINTDATCSIMSADGTILDRRFINYRSDKDYLHHTLNKIKSVSKKQGSHNTSKLWRIAKFHNEELSRKIAKAISEYAKEQQCDVIVFEYLEFNNKPRGKAKQKLHMWRKQSIQNIVTNKAHKQGMRISRVNTWGTSRFAFDGSGVVLRGKDAGLDTYSLCRFQTGKIYNCDLSASYNIGARYFVREIQKTTTAKQWSQLVAKVPLIEKRSQCTLSTLKELVA